MGRFGQLLESATDLFGGGGGGCNDDVPWSTPDDILDLERELAEAKNDKSEDRINKSTMRLSCALVYSRQRADRKRGIAMLKDSLTNSNRVFQKHQMLYLLAIGYYRSGDSPTSMRLVDRCLEIAPNWEEALSLKKTIEEKMTTTEDSWIGIGVAVGGVVAAGGIAAVCGTGIVSGMTAVVVRRAVIYTAGGVVGAYGILAANRVAASASSSSSSAVRN